MSVGRLPLVIWGCGGHARVVADIVRLQNKYEILGFLDDLHPSRRHRPFCEHQILGGREQLQKIKEMGVKHFIFAFGDNFSRLKLSIFIKKKGFQLATAIHPQSIVAKDVEIGAGTVIMAGAVVNPESILRNNVIINTLASVDHECIIETGAHIGPGAHLAGHVSVGRGAWVGIGAVVAEGIKIGAGAIVGAGAVVFKDVPEGVLAYGTPAKVIRKVVEPKSSLR